MRRPAQTFRPYHEQLGAEVAFGAFQRAVDWPGTDLAALELSVSGTASASLTGVHGGSEGLEPVVCARLLVARPKRRYAHGRTCPLT